MLIANELAISLLKALSRAFVFDDDKWNTVDETNDVASACQCTARSFNHKLRANMVDIIVRVFPINKTKSIALAIPFDVFGYGGTQHQKVIDFLIGSP